MIVFYYWINYGICQKGKFVFVILCRHQWNWQWHIFWLMEKKYASRGTKQLASKNVLTKYKIVMQPQHAQYMKWGSEWVSLIMNALGNNRCPHTWQLNHGTLFWRTLNYIIDNIQKIRILANRCEVLLPKSNWGVTWKCHWSLQLNCTITCMFFSILPFHSPFALLMEK